MNFYNASATPRPVRLCAASRLFAQRSLDGIYGREAKLNFAVTMDDVPNWEGLSPQQRYNLAVRRIVTQAPVRITDEERVSGCATLGLGIRHQVPAVFDGKPVCESVSHLTPGFDRALVYGIDDYERRTAARLADPGLTADEQAVLQGIANVIDCMHIWHGRIMDALRVSGNPHADEIRANLAPVPFAPPANFRQAVQALWFLFSFLRLLGNWPGIGRIDMMLGKYLDADLASGAITRDEAREYMAGFIIKGCEWITGEPSVSGDAQHYQNLIIGGLDEDGQDVCCTATELLLEVLEELPISDFPVALRLNAHTPDRILQLVASNVRHGCGVMAIYNEDLVLRSLVRMGYSLRDARRFTNDGCWEVQIPGETNFRYFPFDAYGMFQRDVLGLDKEKSPAYSDFEALLTRWREVLDAHLTTLHQAIDGLAIDGRPIPTSAIDLLEEDCIGSARSYKNRGPKYMVRSPHIGGFPDLVDSLYVIKKLVFDEKKLTFSDFIDVLRADWDGNESLRSYVRSHYVLFGNDSGEVDALAVRLFDEYLTLNDRFANRDGILRPAGASTFGRQIEWSPKRYSHAHGFREGTFLASNLGPTPDTDKEGVSAVIRSHCKLPLERLSCGTALDVKLAPTLLTEDKYASLLTGLMKGFCELGGFFMQMDVVDNQILLDAQAHPENYRNLSVRVAGWSARFVTLSRAWQDMIIARTTQQQ